MVSCSKQSESLNYRLEGLRTLKKTLLLPSETSLRKKDSVSAKEVTSLRTWNIVFISTPSRPATIALFKLVKRVALALWKRHYDVHYALRLPEHIEPPESSVSSGLETLRQGAQYVWQEIRDEQDWARLPPPKKIRDHVISTFPGLALVHYYWKSRHNNASR